VNKQFETLFANLANLGAKRLVMMALAALVALSMIAAAAKYLNKPAYEVLYVGLDRDDVNRMGIALSDAGIGFDVDSSGATVLVEAGQTSRARMILAEKGLPASSGSGYELFDNLGSLGLTSFMQEVTRVRALEGEIARTIQSISGIKAARVHIVMADRGGFRDRDRKPTASVLIRASDMEMGKKASAIRHLVSSAIPGLASDDVTVMDDAGHLLAAGQDPVSGALNGALDIESTIEGQLEQNIVSAIAPSLGALNYRVSVRAEIDTDRRQTEETIYDPESRVERSTQLVKAKDSSSQKSNSQPASVEQNLPGKTEASVSGPQSTALNDRQEETTNYEVNSKTVSTTSNGYRVNRLSVSIVLNRKKISELLGGKPDQAAIDQRIADISKVASTAVGYDEKRGDTINVAAIEFVDEAGAGAESAPSILEKMSAYTGSAINAAAFIVVALLVLLLGLRPLIAAIANLPDATSAASAEQGLARERRAFDAGQPPSSASSTSRLETKGDASDIAAAVSRPPRERIEAIADLDEERAAHVLRRWITEEAA
jgi:flagellar M-ring protein FliF